MVGILPFRLTRGQYQVRRIGEAVDPRQVRMVTLDILGEVQHAVLFTLRGLVAVTARTVQTHQLRPTSCSRCVIHERDT